MEHIDRMKESASLMSMEVNFETVVGDIKVLEETLTNSRRVRISNFKRG